MTVAPEYSTDSGADGLWEGVQPEPARRLLVAGLGLFAVQGLHGTTTRDIAARAGMSPAALYVHYRTKEDLLVGWVFLLFDDLPRLAGLRSFADAVMPALRSGRDEGTEPP